MQPLPPSFVAQMQALLGDAFADFNTALLAPAPVSIRTNPDKIAEGVNAGLFPGSMPVPWCPNAWYLSERPVFTLDPRFHAGAYYVQEASSMFLHEAMRQAVDFSPPLRVLDLCAAPGGKSTLLASMLGPDSLLVANEVIRPRTTVLRENLEKWGTPNCAVTCAGSADFAPLEDWFDVVVTDAPCSGEGLFRKDPDAMREWSPAAVEACALRQRTILEDAVNVLKPGGVLAYSTCTFNRLENESNASWLQTAFNLKPIQLDLPADWGIVETEGGYRFFPHRLQGEGFFIALFRKPAAPGKKTAAASGFRNIQPLAKKLIPALKNWLREDVDLLFFQTPTGDVLALQANLTTEYLILDAALKNKWFGTNIGQFKGTDFVPSHALALSMLAAPTLPHAELSREQALLFLKKENFELPAGSPDRGWALARYQGLNLGWMKILPNRWNNYLPQERRIRMEVR